MKKRIASILLCFCVVMLFAKGAKDASSQPQVEATDTAAEETKPDIVIYVTRPQNKALVAHEIEHQSQYQTIGTKVVFEQLLQELTDYQNGKNPYTTEGTLEYSAQLVQDNVEFSIKEAQHE